MNYPKCKRCGRILTWEEIKKYWFLCKSCAYKENQREAGL